MNLLSIPTQLPLIHDPLLLQVKIWFQNRRMKWRNSKERELLASGGSREQTLPTKNNPNPDLSDVAEEAARSAASSAGGAKDDLVLQGSDDPFQKDRGDESFQIRDDPPSFVSHHHHQQARAVDAFSTSLASALPAKIQIKDLTALSNYSKAAGSYAASFPYQEADGDYSDEDINVTDELGASNNEDSEND